MSFECESAPQKANLYAEIDDKKTVDSYEL